MCLEEERSHDAKVSPAAADGPKQIAILVRAGNDKSTVGEDNISCQKVINGQAVLPRQVSHSAAESQSSNAGRGNNS